MHKFFTVIYCISFYSKCQLDQSIINVNCNTKNDKKVNKISKNLKTKEPKFFQMPIDETLITKIELHNGVLLSYSDQVKNKFQKFSQNFQLKEENSNSYNILSSIYPNATYFVKTDYANGWSMAVGDLNNDGFDDLLIGFFFN